MKRIVEFVQDDSGKLSMGRLVMIIMALAMVAGALIKCGQDAFYYSAAGLIAALYTGNKFSPTLPFGGSSSGSSSS